MKASYRMSFCEDIFPDVLKLVKAAEKMREEQTKGEVLDVAEVKFDKLLAKIQKQIKQEQELRK